MKKNRKRQLMAWLKLVLLTGIPLGICAAGVRYSLLDIVQTAIVAGCALFLLVAIYTKNEK